jgi:large subunit ribosomal protein L4
MATVDVVTVENQKSGSVELEPAIFDAVVKPHLFQAEVRRQLALRRSGTHSTKNRARVSGGGAKPYRQKGTGRARQGTTRAAQFAGGGVVFGPVPRDYSHSLTKKMRRAALRSALSFAVKEGNFTVVDALDSDEFKTKHVVGILDSLGLSGKTVLIVLDESNPRFEASARNIPGVTVIRAEGLNVYDTLRHKHMLVTQAALEALATRLAVAKKESAS